MDEGLDDHTAGGGSVIEHNGGLEVHMLVPEAALAEGIPVRQFHSSDGGRSFQEIPMFVTQDNTFSGKVHQIVGAPPGHMLAGATGPQGFGVYEQWSVIARTPDAGKTWFSGVRETVFNDLTDWDIRDFITGVDDTGNIGFAVGVVNTLSATPYHILRTRTRGFYFDLHHNLSAMSGALVRLNTIQDLGGGRLLAGGLNSGGATNPSVWRSLDMGESWTEIQLPGTYGAADHEINDITVVGQGIVLAGGRSPLSTNLAHYPPRLYRSTNYGETWTEITDSVSDISYTDDQDHSVTAITVFANQAVALGLAGDPTAGSDNFRISQDMGLTFSRVGYFATPYI